MNELLRRRVALITGKGGVGRTSVTCALAHLAHREGLRVLVAEMGDSGEDYSALARLFGKIQLPRTAEEIAPGIFGSQLLPDVGAELFVKSVLRIQRLAKAALGFPPLRRLLEAAPSLRELGIFFHLLTYFREELSPGVPKYQAILVDMPATGHTLALTGMPEVVLRLVKRGPIAQALREGRGHLSNPEVTKAWVVTLPETLPVSEALELVEGLTRTEVPCGGILVNRIPTDPFDPAEKAALEPFLADRKVYGAEGFHRILESQRMMDRLRQGTALPVMALPEITPIDTGPVQGLVRALESARLVGPEREPASVGQS